MNIRYFATTDDSPTGRMALSYLGGMLRIAPVRVGSMSSGLSGAWEPLGRLLVTPMHQRYVNVVCAPPSRWTWDMSIPMRTADGTRIDGVAKGRAELYTANVHNVLLAGEVPTDQHAIATARRYEVVVVPTLELVVRWRDELQVTACRIPIPVTDLEAFRRLVMPT